MDVVVLMFSKAVASERLREPILMIIVLDQSNSIARMLQVRHTFYIRGFIAKLDLLLVPTERMDTYRRSSKSRSLNSRQLCRYLAAPPLPYIQSLDWTYPPTSVSMLLRPRHCGCAQSLSGMEGSTKSWTA
jgi:hypothetical protein